MLIGILDCDRVDSVLAAEFGQYGDMIRAALQHVEPAVRCQLFDGQGEPLPDPGKCDGWIISGSQHSAYDSTPWIIHLSEWIRQTVAAGHAIAGICFGHQLLAQALGGQVAKAKQGWGMGPYRTRIIDTATWIDPATTDLTLLASHRDQVTELPPGARCLASSAFCPLYSFALDDRVFTVQGHPEFVAAYNRALADRRRALIGEAVYQRAITALDQPVDSDRFMRWLLAFFHHRVNNRNARQVQSRAQHSQ